MNPASSLRPPSSGTKTGRVWEIADGLYAATGRKPKIREIVELYLREDPARSPNTAQTAFMAWKRQKESAEATAVNGGDAREDRVGRLVVLADGSLRVPPALVRGLNVAPDGVVMATVLEGELRLTTPAAGLRNLQELLRPLRRDGVSIVDEFLTERRATWGEE